MYKITLLLVCFLIWGSSLQRIINNNAQKYKTWISVTNKSNIIMFTGKFKNNTDEDINISYSLIVIKSGSLGTSNSSQSGKKSVNKNAVVTLSTVNLDYIKNNKYRVNLEVFKNNTIIGSDSVKIN